MERRRDATKNCQLLEQTQGIASVVHIPPPPPASSLGLFRITHLFVKCFWARGPNNKELLNIWKPCPHLQQLSRENVKSQGRRLESEPVCYLGHTHRDTCFRGRRFYSSLWTSFLSAPENWKDQKVKFGPHRPVYSILVNEQGAYQRRGRATILAPVIFKAQQQRWHFQQCGLGHRCLICHSRLVELFLVSLYLFPQNLDFSVREFQIVFRVHQFSPGLRVALSFLLQNSWCPEQGQLTASRSRCHAVVLFTGRSCSRINRHAVEWTPQQLAENREKFSTALCSAEFLPGLSWEGPRD